MLIDTVLALAVLAFFTAPAFVAIRPSRRQRSEILT